MHCLYGLFIIFVYTKATQPRSVNIALNTELQFNNKRDIEIINTAQKYLDKIKEILLSNYEIEEPKTKGSRLFTNFFAKCVKILNLFADDDLKKLLDAIEMELSEFKYNSGVTKLVRLGDLQQYFIKKLTEIKYASVAKIRRNLSVVSKIIKTDHAVLNFIDSLYKENSEEKFKKVLNNLKLYSKRTLRSEQMKIPSLRNIVNSAFRTIFIDQYTTLSASKRQKIKDLIKKYLGDNSHIFKKGRKDKRLYNKNPTFKRDFSDFEVFNSYSKMPKHASYENRNVNLHSSEKNMSQEIANRLYSNKKSLEKDLKNVNQNGINKDTRGSKEDVEEAKNEPENYVDLKYTLKNKSSKRYKLRSNKLNDSNEASDAEKSRIESPKTKSFIKHTKNKYTIHTESSDSIEYTSKHRKIDIVRKPFKLYKKQRNHIGSTKKIKKFVKKYNSHAKPKGKYNIDNSREDPLNKIKIDDKELLQNTIPGSDTSIGSLAKNTAYINKSYKSSSNYNSNRYKKRISNLYFTSTTKMFVKKYYTLHKSENEIPDKSRDITSWEAKVKKEIEKNKIKHIKDSTSAEMSKDDSGSEDNQQEREALNKSKEIFKTALVSTKIVEPTSITNETSSEEEQSTRIITANKFLQTEKHNFTNDSDTSDESASKESSIQEKNSNNIETNTFIVFTPTVKPNKELKTTDMHKKTSNSYKTVKLTHITLYPENVDFNKTKSYFKEGDSRKPSYSANRRRDEDKNIEGTDDLSTVTNETEVTINMDQKSEHTDITNRFSLEDTKKPPTTAKFRKITVDIKDFIKVSDHVNKVYEENKIDAVNENLIADITKQLDNEVSIPSYNVTKDKTAANESDCVDPKNNTETDTEKHRRLLDTITQREPETMSNITGNRKEITSKIPIEQAVLNDSSHNVTPLILSTTVSSMISETLIPKLQMEANLSNFRNPLTKTEIEAKETVKLQVNSDVSKRKLVKSGKDTIILSDIKNPMRSSSKPKPLASMDVKNLMKISKVNIKADMEKKKAVEERMRADLSKIFGHSKTEIPPLKTESADSFRELEEAFNIF